MIFLDLHVCVSIWARYRFCFIFWLDFSPLMLMWDARLGVAPRGGSSRSWISFSSTIDHFFCAYPVSFLSPHLRSFARSQFGPPKPETPPGIRVRPLIRILASHHKGPPVQDRVSSRGGPHEATADGNGAPEAFLYLFFLNKNKGGGGGNLIGPPLNKQIYWSSLDIKI